jgi:hypothetical protein
LQACQNTVRYHSLTARWIDVIEILCRRHAPPALEASKAWAMHIQAIHAKLQLDQRSCMPGGPLMATRACTSHAQPQHLGLQAPNRHLVLRTAWSPPLSMPRRAATITPACCYGHETSRTVRPGSHRKVGDNQWDAFDELEQLVKSDACSINHSISLPVNTKHWRRQRVLRGCLPATVSCASLQTMQFTEA